LPFMAQFLAETGSGVTAEIGSIHYTAHTFSPLLK